LRTKGEGSSNGWEHNATLIAATTVTLAYLLVREGANRRAEDRRRFLEELASDASEVWGAAEMYRRNEDENAALWTGSKEAEQEMRQFIVAFAQLHIPGDLPLVNAAGKDCYSHQSAPGGLTTWCFQVGKPVSATAITGAEHFDGLP
jgi:hypothetical protein